SARLKVDIGRRGLIEVLGFDNAVQRAGNALGRTRAPGARAPGARRRRPGHAWATLRTATATRAAVRLPTSARRIRRGHRVVGIERVEVRRAIGATFDSTAHG